jgi:transposase
MSWIGVLPLHGFRRIIVLPDIAHDLPFQILLRRQDAARDEIAPDLRKPVDYLEEAIERLSQQIEEQLRPFAETLAPLDATRGDQRTIEGIVAEIGIDLSPFPSDRHLTSWAGICPGNHESAGKHQSGKTRKGNRWLHTTLMEAALAPSGSKAVGWPLAIGGSCGTGGTKRPSWPWRTPSS